MDIFNIIREKRASRLRRFGGQVYTDRSEFYLEDFKDAGYTQVTFKANLAADPDCKRLDRNIYNIDDLLKLEQPLFQTSHINCQCEFVPYEKSKQTQKEPDFPGDPGFLEEPYEEEDATGFEEGII